MRTSALSTIAFALSGMAAYGGQDGLWQPQVRAIVGANNDGATAALEGFVPLKQTAESVLFLDVRAKHDFEDGFGQDFGLGIRRIVNLDVMLGGYAYINTQRQDGHQFTGATLGVEAITANFDAHVNVYLPISGDRAEQSVNSSLSMVGNQLLEQIAVIDRRNYAAWGIEGEIGAQVPVELPEDHSLRLSIGAYHFGDPDGDDDNITGGKAGFEYAIGDVFGSGASVAFTGEVRNDNRDDTQFAGSVRLTIPFNADAGGVEEQGDSGEPVYAVSDALRKRVNERVRGDIGVRIEGDEKLASSTTRVAINAATGTAFGKFFFADGANTLGLGTFGDPTTLDDAVSDAGVNGFVVALGGSGNLLTAGVTLANGQTVIGGGESVTAQLFGGGTGNYNLGGSNGTIAGTNPGNNVITLGNGNTLRGITVTGGADGIFGNNINGATLTNVTVSGTGGHGANFTGSSTGIRGSNFTSTGNGLDGLHIAGNGTYNFTGTTLLQDNGDDGLDIAGQGTYTFAILNAQDNADAGIYVAGTSVSGSFTTSGGTVSGNGGIAVFIDPITAHVTLTSITHNGGTSGVVLDNVAGSFTVTGQTTISNTSGPAIDIVNSPASIRFGDVNITNPGGDGIAFAGVNAAIVAGNIVISGLGVGTGLDFSGSRTNFTAQSFNITGTGAGSIGIDLAQTIGGSSIVITNGGVIANVGTGVRLGISGSLVNSANAQFSFGGGSISGVTASLDARGLNQTLGTYAFGTTTFGGPQLFDAQNLIFVGASATGSGTGSSLLDLASIATADANTDGTAIFVLVNRGTDIDDTDGFSLSAGQTLASFGNGRQFSLGGVPINVTGTNVQHSTTISDAGGAATLTNTGSGDTVTLANNTSLLDVDLSNAGGGNGVFGNNVTNVTLTGLTVSGADLNGLVFAGTSTVSGSNLTSSNNGSTGLSIQGGGTYVFTGTTTLADNGGSGLAISGGTGAYSFDTLNATGNGGNGVGASGTSAGELSIGNGTISGNGLTGFLASGIGLDVTLASLSQTNGSTGISLAGVSGDFAVSGTTTISGTAFNGIVISGSSATVSFAGATTITNAGNGVSLGGNSGAISFADVTISQPGQNAIDVQGTNGTISFQNIDITNLSATSTGLDLSGSSSTFTVATLDISGLGGTSTGIDLSGTTGGMVSIGSGVISGVGTGVQMGDHGAVAASANTTFSFGGGSITGTVASLDMRGLLVGNGTYAYNTTALVGPQLFDTANVIFVGSGNTGSGDGSSIGNLINAAAADDLTVDANTIFVLVKSSALDVINTDGDGFTLANGQSVVSFANGATVDLGAPPANVTGANVATGATQGDPFSHGGATLNNAAGSAINLANGNLIQNLTVSNGGSGAAIDGTSISGLNVAGVTIASAVTGIDLSSATGTISIANLSIQSAQTGILLANSAATVNFTGTSTVGGVTGTALSFNNYSGTATFADFNITGAATGINIAGGSTGTLNFDAASSIANTSGVAFNIDTATPNLIYNGTINQTSGASAVRVNAMTGGSATFGGLITASTGGANAINLTSNTGGTISFNNGLAITTTTGIGFNATGGGTINVAATAGTETISTDTGQAINLDGVTIGTGDVSFDSITTGITAWTALNFNAVGGGTFSGGTVTIAGTTGVGDGIQIVASSATFNFASAKIDNTAGRGIALTGANGNVTFTTVDIDGTAGRGIDVSGAINLVSVGGGTIGASLATGGRSINIDGQAATSTISLTNLAVTSVADALLIRNSAGTITMTGGSLTQSGLGNALDIEDSSAAISVGATISHAGSGHAVEIDGTSGNTTISGNVTATGGAQLFSIGTTTAPTGGTISFTGSSLTATGGGGALIAGLGAGASFNAAAAISITSPLAAGLSVVNAAGSATFGSVTVSGAATGIGLSGNTGTIAFGATSVTNVGLNQTGVAISGTNAGTLSFASLGIAMTGNDATGISFANAVINGTITATDFDLTSVSSTGTTAVNLSSTTGTGTIQLGDAGAPGNTTAATIGGSGAGPAVGFQFTSTTAVNFIYGDGEGSVDKLSTVKAVDIMASPGGVFPAAGTYNFKDVDGANGGFVGDLSEAQGPTVYYVDSQGDGNGTAANPGSIAGAEASGADVIVFIDTTVNGTSDFIDMMQAQHNDGANNTFNLADGQVLIGLKAGESIDTAPLGAVGGGLGNAFQFSGISSSTIIDAPAGIDTVLPTLTTAIGNTISLGANASIVNVIVANTGATGIGIYGFDIAKLILSRATISGGGGGALSLDDGGADSEVALSNLILSATGGNIASIDGTGVGTGVMKVSALSDITLLGNNGEIGGFALSGVVFDANAATAGMDQVDGGAFVAGTTTNRVGGYGLILDDTSSGNLKFDTTSIAVQQASNPIFGGDVALGIYANPLDGSSSTLDFGAATIDVAGGGSAGGFFNGAHLLVNSTNRIGFSGATSFTGTNGAGGIYANRAAAVGGELFFASASNTFNVDEAALGISNVAVTNGAGGSAQFGAVTVTGGQNGIKLLNVIASPTIQFNGPVTISDTTLNAIDLTSGLVNGTSVTFAGAVSITNANGGGVKWQPAVGSTNTLTFAGALDIQNNGGIGFYARSGNVVLSGVGAKNVTTTNGRALVVDGANVSDGAAGAGVFNNISASGYLNGGGIDINAGSGAMRFAGTVNLTPLASQVGTAFGINIGGGTTGTYTFAGTTTINGGSDDNGVYVRNTGAGLTIDFTGPLDVTTGLNAIDLNDTTGNLAFSIQHAASSLTTTTSTGTAFLAVGGSGAISSTASIFSDGLGASISGRTGGTITLSGNITQALRGVEVNGGSGGSVVFSGTQKILNTGTTNAVRVFSPTAVSFINGGLVINTTTGAGISVNGTGGTANVTVSGVGNTVSTGSGTGVDIVGGVGATNVAINAAVTSTTGLAANVQGVTSGTVTLSGNLIAAGIVVNSSTGGTIDFSGATKSLTSGLANAVNLTNNAGATINFSNGGLAINSTSGTGFNASGGGTVTVGTGSNANTIATTTGTALSLNGATVGAAGLNFATVSASGAATGIVLTNVASSGGGAVALGTVNLQGITVRGVDISGTLGAAISFNDLDIGLNGSAIAFDLNGATINAAVTANDFDVTNSAAAGTSIGVDLRGATGGQTVRLGDAVAGGTSSSIAGVNTGIFLNSATNLGFTYGDGESATDQLSTIGANVAIDASSAPAAGSYNFQDVNFQASPGLGFGIGKVYFVDSDGATGGGNGSGTDGNNPMTLAAAEAVAGVNDIIVLINNGSIITAAGTNADNTLNLAAGAQVRGFGNGAINLALTVPSAIQLASNSISIAAVGTGAATLTSSAGSNIITLGASGNVIDGFILDGSPANVARGIKDNGTDGASGTSVTNMTIRNFLTAGIEITPSTNTTISNVVFSGNGSEAILNASNTTITNVTSTGATGIAFDIRDATGTTTLSNISISGAGAGGISFGGVSGPAGTITGTNVDIGGANALAVTGGNATISFDAASSIANMSGTAVAITNRTGGSFTFAGSVVANGAASGISVSGATAASAVSFTGAVDLGTTTAMTGTAVSVNNNAQASTVSFANLDIVTSTTTGFSVSNGGTVNVTTGTINATSAQAIMLNGVAANTTFISVNSIGGTNNVGLTNVAGTVNLGSGALSGASGAAFLVSGGSANVDYSGTITKTTAGNVVNIASRTGGTLALSGNISATGAVANGISVAGNSGGAITFSGSTKTLTTGANAAVSLAGNAGATINFNNGGLAISTTSGAGFSATGGGTINVLGSNNTISSATGTALNVANTTIGASDLTFRSISSNGAVNGIVLNATGVLGGLTVTGDAGGSNNGSGGTIQNSTGTGVLLTSTQSVNLGYMNILNSADDGIGGTSVTDFALNRSTLTNNGNAIGDAGIDFGGVGTVSPNGLFGTASITNSTITTSYEKNVSIRNSNGTLALTVSNSTFSNTSAKVDSDDGLFLEAGGTATITANVTNNTFTANRGDHFQAAALNSGNLNIKFTGNTLNGGHATALGQGITINAATGVPGYAGTVNYDIDNNSINGAIGSAITVNLGTSSAAALFNGFIRNNDIGTVGVTNSGSTQAFGIAVEAHGNGTHTVAVTNNLVVEAFDRAMNVVANDGNGVLNLTVQSNQLSSNAAGREAFNLVAGGADPNIFGLRDSHTVRLNLGGAGALENTFVHGSGVTRDFLIRQRFDSRLEIVGYAGSQFDTAAALAYVQGRNNGSAGEPGLVTTEGVGPGGFFNGSVPLPNPF
ncbi:inverse autotransporter beta domain-containing protein [Aminobacter carboxidus]|uniref:Inverse autotransporter beta domain-containing protein n=2 Tax=Aminobacter carboxidus TaxID=376165 RepID=A0ABR9GN89_9HYPH|nr:inverse autotransporter beta domain-containing protein [Aminobacter carboxidus]